MQKQLRGKNVNKTSPGLFNEKGNERASLLLKGFLKNIVLILNFIIFLKLTPLGI